MENNKKYQVAMKCSKAQFEEFKQVIQDYGLEDWTTNDFKDYTYVFNYFHFVSGRVSNTQCSYPINYKVIETYDKETFLKACGIEVEPKVFTCKDLSEGIVACVNDGTVEELGKVLKYCFPNDIYIAKGFDMYYYLFEDKISDWDSNDITDLPTQSVKVFLKEIELEEKEFLEKVKMQDTTILGYDPDNVEQPPLKKFINLSSKETSKKETVFTHANFGGDWFTIDSNAYNKEIKQVMYHGELKDNRGSLFVAELNDGQLVVFKGIKGDEFND